MTRRLAWTLAALVPLAFLGVFFAWPVATLIVRGFFPDGAFSLDAFTAVFAAPRTWRVIATTLAQAAAGTLVAVAVGIPGAWLLYRTRFPGRLVVRALVTVPFVLPSVVVGVAFKSLVISTGPLGGLGLGLNLNRVSDDDYWRDFTPRLFSHGSGGAIQSQYVQRLLPGQASLNWARGEHALSLNTLKWQTLQDVTSPITPPYDRLPQLHWRYQPLQLAGGFDASVDRKSVV